MLQNNKQEKILTISIPTWNRCDLLKELIEQLVIQINSKGLADKAEVLVSNNGSEDETDSLVKSYMEDNNFITYNNNGTNIGARANVLKSMELASGKFQMVLGDDDRITDNCLKGLIEYLETAEDIGLVLDSNKFKKNPLGNNTDTDLNGLLENYYWHMGNAGFFIIRTSFVKDNLKNHPYEYFSISWPQIQLEVLGLYQNKDLKVHIENFNILSDSVHAEVMIYNSYYLWRTTLLDLLNAINDIKEEIDEQTVNAAKKYLSDNIKQTFFNILQCGVFIDDKETRLKTADHIKENLYLFSDKEKNYLRMIRAAHLLPSPVARGVSNAFIYATRGSDGMKKKNEYVNGELMKKEKLSKKKSLAVREFKF